MCLRFFAGPAFACAFVLIAVVGTGFCLGTAVVGPAPAPPRHPRQQHSEMGPEGPAPRKPAKSPGSGHAKREPRKGPGALL
jgi:hypothetical protein